MSYYVLRQIRAQGKSALADEATAVALLKAATAGTLVQGAYLQSSDPDARRGRGYEMWTNDLSKAQKFASFEAALECWKAQSTVRPWRPDGKPNRPLTAYSVQPECIKDDHDERRPDDQVS